MHRAWIAALALPLLCGCPQDGGKTGAKTGETAAKTGETAAKTGKTADTPPEGKTAIDIEPAKTGAKKPAPKQTEIPLKDPEQKTD